MTQSASGPSTLLADPRAFARSGQDPIQIRAKVTKIMLCGLAHTEANVAQIVAPAWPYLRHMGLILAGSCPDSVNGPWFCKKC